MKTLFRNTLSRPVVAIALAMAGLAAGGTAHALGTTAGTAITNLATLNYSVGGAAQTAIGSSETGNTTGAGTATSFLVDNKINLLVATTDTTLVSVVPGLTGVTGANPNGATQVTTFTVTNTGNSVQDYSLAVANLAASTTLFTGTDNFDGTACVARVESGGTPGYDATDTATFIDELAPDGVKTVYVICAIPVARVNNDVAVVSLTATALAGGTAGAQGAALVETTGANTAGVDIVFADGAGTDDAIRNANYSARSGFKVVTATLTVTKAVVAVCDPFNGSTLPKNIPGSFVRYTITIANTGAASATLSTVGDTLTNLVTFDPSLITGAGGPATAATTCASTGTPTSAAGSGFLVPVVGTRAGFPKYFTTTSSVDGIDLTGGNLVTVNFGLVLPVEAGYTAGELKATESVSVIYQVKIN
jgi:hypothetical protein